MDLAERLQVPPDYPAAGIIAMLAGALGRRASVRPYRYDPWTVIPNLWGAIVGRSGLTFSMTTNYKPTAAGSRYMIGDDSLADRIRLIMVYEIAYVDN